MVMIYFKKKQLDKQIVEMFNHGIPGVEFTPFITAEQFLDESNILQIPLKIRHIKMWILETMKLAKSLK